MHPARIAELLEPFLGTADDQRLTANDLQDISTYIDVLLRWNAHINLTAIRNQEEIATRHFGESLFAARHLFPARLCRRERPRSCSLIDVGSGAGFPGLPIKIWAPDIDLTLIESNQKKATFLREVTRKLTLTDVNVFPGRAADYPNTPAETVTLRAVERFDAAVPIAAHLVAPAGRLALLIGQAQLARSRELASNFAWKFAIPVPLSANRVLAIGIRET
ncbi:MAG: 16S rRNA (guanine(527)-N(7))-methyltransferase RsmG [Terriglobales bacterium]